MKAIGFFRYGGPEVLQFVETPPPAPRPRDIVVRVKAVSVNPVDSKVRRGIRGSPLVPGVPSIPGWDASGVVASVGPEARRFKPDDEVYLAGDITRSGSYAEFVAADERIAERKPRSLSFEQAAAVPLVALTAWESFAEQMGVPEGEGGGKVALIVGGAGGVGSMAIQLAKKVFGLRVIATASRRESAEFCRKMGADEVVDHEKELAPQVPGGADYVLNTADKPDWKSLVALLRPFGRICSILPAAGADLTELFWKRGALSFESMFARSTFGVEFERQGAILEKVAALYDRGVLKSAVTRVDDWSEFRQAHARIDGAHTVGKIVLRVAP